MEFGRRNFLRSAALLAACSFSEIDVLAAKKQLETHNGDVAPDDEEYWKNVRQLFPLSKDRAYLNNGTMGPSPYPVIDAVHKGIMINDRDGDYNGYNKTVKPIARFLNVDKKEIALTHNVTEGINIVVWGLPLSRKDEVILTTHEHVGNALPWLRRQQVDGIVIKTFTPAKTAAETLERIEALISKRTRVIAVPHIPCTQGQVLPVKDICTLARSKGIYSCIDGAHGPGMLPVDLQDIGCDTYAGCFHKWMLGPKGSGFLYINENVQDMVQPYFVGGEGDMGNWDLTVDPALMADMKDTAHKYFGGTRSLPNAMGVMAAIEFIESIGIENIYNRVKYLGAYVQERLLGFGDKVELLTPTESVSYCGVNGFRIRNVDYKEFFKHCMDNKVRIRAVPENGLNCLRVSTHIYNNKGEIDKLMELIDKYSV